MFNLSYKFKSKLYLVLIRVTSIIHANVYFSVWELLLTSSLFRFLMDVNFPVTVGEYEYVYC